jgi:hypothetical protein
VPDAAAELVGVADPKPWRGADAAAGAAARQAVLLAPTCSITRGAAPLLAKGSAVVPSGASVGSGSEQSSWRSIGASTGA